MISLVGGDLYQWDTGRIILVKPDNGTTVQEVHFTTKKMDYAYVAKTYKNGSSIYCAIPSILLQQYQDLYCYEVKENSDGEESISTSVFKITKRNRPVDYVYTEPEKFTYKQLEERVSKLEISLKSVQTSVDETHDMVEEIKIDVGQSVKELNDSVSAVQNKVDETTDNFESSISEINDRVTQATALATEAKNSITEITTTANNASTVANEAKRVADEATSNIAGIRTIATNASTAAAEAKKVANEASSNVSEVRTIANNAQTGISTTNQEVEKLKTSIADVKSTADELKTTAVKSVNGITPDDKGNVTVQEIVVDEFEELKGRVDTLETSVSDLDTSTSSSMDEIKASVSDLGTATSSSIDEIKTTVGELSASTSSSIEEVKASIAGVKTISDSTSTAVSELQNTVVKSVNGNLPDNSGNVSIQAVLGDDFTKLENRVNTFEGTLESTRLTSEETATTVGELKEVLESVKTGQTELQKIVNELKASLEEVKKNMVRTVNNVHPDTNGNVTISATSTDTPTTTQYNHFVEFGSETGTFGSGKYEECIEFTSTDGTTGSVDLDNDGGSIEF